jgi:hypothetical protein
MPQAQQNKPHLRGIMLKSPYIRYIWKLCHCSRQPPGTECHVPDTYSGVNEDAMSTGRWLPRRFEGSYCFLRQGQAVQGHSFETSEDFNLFRPHIRSSYSPFICPPSSLFPCPLCLFLPFFLFLVLSYSPLKDFIHILSMGGFHSSSLW